MTTATLVLPSPATGTRVFVALVLWFSVLFGLGVAGLLERPFPPLVPLGLAAATAAVILAARRNASLRAWIGAIDLRIAIAYHVLRAPIGVWFLAEYASGALPGELALRAGWGDIATGVLALAVLPLGLATRRDRRLVWAWNAFGLVDIAMVVLTAQKLLVIDHSPQLLALGFPFMLLPWFVVPLVIATHVLIFARLRTAARDA
ncbi:MAG TPA: hypothetical protein VG755_22025 [Nannocystaceae bacterium]|nr:hypothetical protein [Nannocystaceae bacterium]